MLISTPAMSNSGIVKFDAYCVDARGLGEMLAEYEELPMMTMASGRTIKGSDKVFPSVLFANPKTKTWTLAEQVGENVYCVVATGSEIAPYREK
jgi:hypothetical protein